jgi:serine/threonine-protein kinase
MPIEHLGPYRIERLLGRGGMGAVYAGVHQETGAAAAIKVLAESLAVDSRFRERFQGEVETLKRLRHKNIVTLQGYGEEDGVLYFVMDLVDGPSLDGELRGGRRFSWREVVDIGVQVCAALKHAHDHGVVHRDLKPANLMLAADGTVKLTDFGIAKFFGGTSLTLAGSMVGTPDFMSPEQIEGKPATPRSDLYSLGCVLYALLTGKPPFSGATITAVMDRVRFETPRPVRLAAPQTPLVLDDIISQLLRKNSDERIATPQLLANLLQAMTHALSVRDESAAKLAGQAEGSGDTTVIGDIEQPLAPETAGVPRQPPPPPGMPINSAPNSGGSPAMATAASVNPPVASDLGETVEYTLEREVAAEQETERRTHFTPVSEREWRSALGAESGPVSSRRERLSIALLAAAVLAVAGTVVFLALPLSADKLYRRIQDSAAQPDQRDRCSRYLAEFLERFPKDARAAEIGQLQADLQCQSLRQELSGKVRTLTDLEQAYLDGMNLAEQGRWPDAAARFQQVVEGLEPRVLSAADRRLLDRARHMRDKSRRLASAAAVSRRGPRPVRGSRRFPSALNARLPPNSDRSPAVVLYHAPSWYDQAYDQAYPVGKGRRRLEYE